MVATREKASGVRQERPADTGGQSGFELRPLVILSSKDISVAFLRTRLPIPWIALAYLVGTVGWAFLPRASAMYCAFTCLSFRCSL